MKIIPLVYLIFIGIFIITCTTSKVAVESSGRQIRPSDVKGYHSPVSMRIAWFPYNDLTIKKRSDNDWVVVKNDSTAKKGAMPVILVDYLNGTDSVWINMNTDNETLGKLIKHTLMTEEPIKKPFASYFEISKCGKCHPAEIDKGF
jgi:hypothetical protein